ncbi:MAG TPA: FtsX-like permease family protein [Mycobacteriales bacterium]|nr:FtsX-like permease family protein [Mycobacteriales bacterium]
MTTLLLGVRMAVRGSRTRVVVTGLALAFAVAFLLGVLGALPARQAKLDRIAERQPVSVGSIAAAGERPSGHSLQLSGLYSAWRGRSVSGWQVVNAKDGTVLPPGVRRLPRPGELLVSPDLGRALRGPDGDELAPRLPGKVIGEIGPAGLSGPHELLAYVGVTRPSAPYPGQDVVRFGHPSARSNVPQELRVAAQLGAAGLLLPVLVLVGTATRLSAGARERRLATVRLVGGTPPQVALLVAGEALVVGVLGAALGLVAFLLLRPLGAALVPVDGGVFAADLRPPTGQLLAVLLLVPVVSLLVSLLAMRRMVVDPLGVRRQARRRSRAGWWRVVPLGAGLVLLGLLWLRHHDLAGPDVAILLGGGALTVIGLAVVAPAVSRLAGVALVRMPGTASRLAGRRLLADPSATARTLTGTVLVVFVGTWLLAFLPILQVSNGSDARDLSRVLPGTSLSLSVGSELGSSALAAVRAVPGVREVVTIGSAQLVKPESVVAGGVRPDAEIAQVAVARCSDLASLLHRSLPCDRGLVFRGVGRDDVAYGPLRTGRSEVLNGQGRPGGAVVIPAPAADLELGRAAYALLQGGYVVDPTLLPRAATSAFSGRLLITTDGRSATTERVRNALFAQGVFGAQTLSEELAEQDRVVRGYQRAARLGLVLAVLVGGVSLLVASLDAVRARRRELAALAAVGVPVGVLRRALLLEVVAPLLGCTAVALGCGAFAAGAYLAADTYYRDAVGLPWAAWGGVAATAVAVVVAVTSITLPFTRGAARPEHLRTE